MIIEFKRATIYDLERIDNIETSLDNRILSYTTLQNTLNKNTYYYFVAVVDNNIVGYICAEHLVDHFDLLAIAVLKEYRRQNIASMLLNQLFKSCINLNIPEIFLEVRQNNNFAIAFYEKAEFKKIHTRKNYYGDTHEDAYIYKKTM